MQFIGMDHIGPKMREQESESGTRLNFPGMHGRGEFEVEERDPREAS